MGQGPDMVSCCTMATSIITYFEVQNLHDSVGTVVLLTTFTATLKKTIASIFLPLNPFISKSTRRREEDSFTSGLEYNTAIEHFIHKLLVLCIHKTRRKTYLLAML